MKKNPKKLKYTTKLIKPPVCFWRPESSLWICYQQTGKTEKTTALQSVVSHNVTSSCLSTFYSDEYTFVASLFSIHVFIRWSVVKYNATMFMCICYSKKKIYNIYISLKGCQFKLISFLNSHLHSSEYYFNIQYIDTRQIINFTVFKELFLLVVLWGNLFSLASSVMAQCSLASVWVRE